MTISPSVFSLRAMELGDIDSIAPWFENLDDLSLFDRNSPAPIGLEALREYWKTDFVAHSAPPKAYWYIARSDSGVPAAFGGLQSVNYFHGDAVLPVFVGPLVRGQGIGTRMVGMLLDLAFDRLRLTRITTYYREDNQVSAKMIRKAGFKEEGRLRKAWLCDGRYLDMIVAGVLHEDWATRRDLLRRELDQRIILTFGGSTNGRHAWPANGAPQ